MLVRPPERRVLFVDDWRKALDLVHELEPPVYALQAAHETDLGSYDALSEQERLPANPHRTYAELDGLDSAAPVDLGAAIGPLRMCSQCRL
ncbi:hypothetical protein [Amycolatopsis sp. cmx-11-12]|uniref:hypothetical protein n=1 Tax=Amycolatopsis sp. cmx-11-12 TaxID=2785795 RepID=UPI003916D2A4